MPLRSALSIRARDLHARAPANRAGWPRPRLALLSRATRGGFVMIAPLLEVEDVGRQFVARRSVLGRPTAIVTAVDGVSFSLEAGKTLALVGESGCGKSTLGRLVLRLIEPTAGGIRFHGRDVTDPRERGPRPRSRHPPTIFQGAHAFLDTRTDTRPTPSQP